METCGYPLCALAGVIIFALVVIYFLGQSRLTRVYDIAEEAIVISMDAASIERGEHIFRFRGCVS